jgi:hypothetical protein
MSPSIEDNPTETTPLLREPISSNGYVSESLSGSGSPAHGADRVSETDAASDAQAQLAEIQGRMKYIFAAVSIGVRSSSPV